MSADTCENCAALEGQLENLEQLLDDKERTLEKSAVFGKHLLQDKANLENRLEMISQEYALKLEAMTQEIYGLKMRLESKSQLESDIDSFRESCEKDKRTSVSANEKLHSKQTAELKIKITNLRKDLEVKDTELATQLKKVSSLEARLREAQTRTPELHNKSIDKSASGNDFLYYDNVLVENEQLRVKIDELTLEVETTGNRAIINAERIQKLVNELRQSEDKADENYVALSAANGEIHQLRNLLDMARMGEVDPARKGNSLFAEVDDRRKKAEEEFVKLRGKYETLARQYDFKYKQCIDLRKQMMVLVKMCGTKADTDYIKSLSDTLSKLRNEMAVLSSRLAEKEAELGHAQRNANRNEAIVKTATSAGLSDAANRRTFWNGLLDKAESKVEELQKESSNNRFMYIVEADKNLHLTHKLHKTERDVEKMATELLDLQLQLQDFKEREELLRIQEANTSSSSGKSVELTFDMDFAVKYHPEYLGNETMVSKDVENDPNLLNALRAPSAGAMPPPPVGAKKPPLKKKVDKISIRDVPRMNVETEECKVQ